MSRPDNKIIMGFYEIELHHYAAILSLVAPATPAMRMIDPFAGEGVCRFGLSEGKETAQLEHHVTELVNVPVFDAWSTYLWEAGHSAQLVRKTRSAGGINLLSVDLDVDAWTRLITGGLEQEIIFLT